MKHHAPCRLVDLIIFISAVLFITSCIKETYDPSKISTRYEIGTSLSLPIAYGTLTINNLIPTNDTLRKDGDSIRLVVQMDSIYSLNAGEILTVNAGDIGTGIHATFFPPIIPPYRFDSVANQLISIPGRPDIELHHITFKSGSMIYSIQNTIRQPIIFVLGMPNTKKNNVVITDTLRVAAHTTGTGTIDLTNAVSDLTVGGTTVNNLAMNYSIEVDTTGWDGNGFTLADQVVYNFDFNTTEVKSADGYFGKVQFNKDSSMNLGIGNGKFFKRFQGGFNLSQASLNLTYINSIGVPVNLTLNLSANTNAGTATAGGTKPLVLPANINAPPVDSVIVFDKNDNIDKIFVFPFPNTIDYHLIAKVNPNGKTSTSNFITNQSALKFGIKIDIPLAIRSDSLIFADSIKLNTNLLGKLDINYLKLHFAFKNEFPFNIKIKVIPWDSADNKVFSALLLTVISTLAKSS